jgi:hypothetical protein
VSPKNSFQSEMRSPHRISSLDRNLTRSSGKMSHGSNSYTSRSSQHSLLDSLQMFARPLRSAFSLSRPIASVRSFSTTMTRQAELRKLGVIGSYTFSYELITQERVKWFLFQKNWINSRGLGLLSLRLVMRNWMLCSWTRILRLSKRALNL